MVKRIKMKVYKLKEYEIKPNILYDENGKRLRVIAVNYKAYKELTKIIRRNNEKR